MKKETFKPYYFRFNSGNLAYQFSPNKAMYICIIKKTASHFNAKGTLVPFDFNFVTSSSLDYKYEINHEKRKINYEF